MKSIEINGEVRESVGKASTKKLREEGKVPCNMYGGDENIHFSCVAKELRHLVYTPNMYIVKINIGDKVYNAIMQDLQFHPVTDEILHIDFLQVFEDKEVTFQVPVKTTGFAKGVKDGGQLHVPRRYLGIKGLYTNFPDEITIEVDDIELGQSVKVGDLSYENIEFIDNKTLVVVAVRTTRIARGMEPAEEELEAEALEGEETPEEGEGAEDGDKS